MKVNIVYPKPEKEKYIHIIVINILRWLFLLAALSCAVINAAVGGKAWSVIVIWSLHLVWTAVISPDLVQYNRISQFIKIIVNSCIILILIGWLLSPGWTGFVVPIVCSSGMVISVILFLTDIERQAQNIFPLLLLDTASIVCAAVGFGIFKGADRLVMMIMGLIALMVFIICVIILKGGLLREIKKGFHTR